MKVYTYRYMWKIKGSSQVNFKIVSDIEDGLKEFENSLLSVENVEKVAREYLHEYDCSLIGKFDTLLGGEDR